ncbi:unnamed protein product [Phytophthora fragariaefolia]|uniref:Unnamed protein product n=1 Tax=Phytophthora fragariaefolia TaxID=1490495 RepID=A0A9W7CL20_9STRA|nr:unnamed protein product [Phytophthora fragariaefolia]
MDASDMGLAVLNPSANEFIQIAFDSDETKWIVADSKSNKFSINVREHVCIALALWIWGPTWTSLDPDRTVVVKCWSDNRAAVAWSNSLASTNELSQEVNRAIGLAEALFNVRVIASHLPGSTNIAADAASRAWVSPFSEIWTNFSSSWQQVPVPKALRKLYRTFSKTFNPNHWPSRPALSTLHQWQEWCNMLGFSIWLPPQTELHSYQLALFGVHCWKFGWNSENKGNATSTVVSKVSHIAWHHRRVLGYSVGLSDGHKLALNGMRRQDAKSTRKAPVTVALLRIMHKSLDFSQPRHRIIWGAAVLGGFLLLRRSEYLAVGKRAYEFILTRADISFTDKNGKACSTFDKIAEVAIRFRGGKNDQYKQGTIRSIGRSGSNWLCPVHATWFLAQHHRELQLLATEPLCTITSGSIVQVRDISQLIKAAAVAAGEPPQHFGTHSLRSGGASALFAAGVDSIAVKQFGRWRSDAFERYIRLNNHQTSTMARAILNPMFAAANYNGQPPQTRGAAANTSRRGAAAMQHSPISPRLKWCVFR